MNMVKKEQDFEFQNFTNFSDFFYSLFEEIDVVATIEEWVIGSEIGKLTSKSVNGPCERLEDSMAHWESWNR